MVIFRIRILFLLFNIIFSNSSIKTMFICFSISGNNIVIVSTTVKHFRPVINQKVIIIKFCNNLPQ